MDIAPSLRYFHEKYGTAAYQLVAELKQQHREAGIQVVDGLTFLQNLDL